MSQTKVLIVCQDEKMQNQLKVNAAIKKLASDGATLKWTNQDSFQEGKRVGTFDAVFYALGEASLEDVEMCEEYYQYYAVAPVCFIFSSAEGEDGIHKLFKEWNDKVIFKVATDAAQGMSDSFEEAKALYAKLLDSDVKPAFNEFDKDQSGSIDKAELGELSKKLGNELTDADLTTALKDLDLNGDGVIDIDEFARWYFSGMKSYGSNKRSMLKFHGKATRILAKTKEQARLALVGQELKTKTHKVALGFNDPSENAGLKIDLNLKIGGKDHHDQLEELSSWLNDTQSQEYRDNLEKKLAAHEDMKAVKLFAQIKINTSNAEEKVAKMIVIRDKAVELINKEGATAFVGAFVPQIKAEGDSIKIGIEFKCQEKLIHRAEFLKAAEETGATDLIEMFKEVSQNIRVQIALGAGLKSILSEEEKETPLLKHLAKGFKVSTQITLVSNLKKAISEMLKSDVEEEQELGQAMMMFAPAFIFGINANMKVDFDDFEEVAEHPMAAPAMATFEQLFEGLLEEGPDSFINKKLDLSECETNLTTRDQMNFVIEMIESVCDLDDPAFNSISVKASCAEVPVSLDVNVETESLGHGIKLAMKAGLLNMIAKQAADIFDKEVEEIFHD